MVESTTNPANEELLARIAKLEAQVAQLTEIAAETSEIRKRFGRFTIKVDVLGEAFTAFQDQVIRCNDDLYDRMMNLEMFVFPNLVGDLKSVHRIIGLEAVKTPLDYRKIPESEK
jgi:hypothetical protein